MVVTRQPGSAEVFVVGGGDLARTVTAALAPPEFIVDRVDTAEVALYEHARRDVGVVITAAALPGMDGIELCRVLKDRAAVPVVVATTVEGPVALAAFAAGADDVLVLPCDPAVVRARVRALVRRTRGPLRPRRVLRIGPFVVRRDPGGVLVPLDERVTLTPLEQTLLDALAERPGCVIDAGVLRQRAVDRHGRRAAEELDDALAHLAAILDAVGAADALQRIPDGGWRLAA